MDTHWMMLLFQDTMMMCNPALQKTLNKVRLLGRWENSSLMDTPRSLKCAAITHTAELFHYFYCSHFYMGLGSVVCFILQETSVNECSYEKIKSSSSHFELSVCRALALDFWSVSFDHIFLIISCNFMSLS